MKCTSFALIFEVFLILVTISSRRSLFLPVNQTEVLRFVVYNVRLHRISFYLDITSIETSLYCIDIFWGFFGVKCIPYFMLMLLCCCSCRFQKQMEEEEQAFQQQRRRLYAEIQEEKERLATQAQRQRKELDQLKEKLEVR